MVMMVAEATPRAGRNVYGFGGGIVLEEGLEVPLSPGEIYGLNARAVMGSGLLSEMNAEDGRLKDLNEKLGHAHAVESVDALMSLAREKGIVLGEKDREVLEGIVALVNKQEGVDRVEIWERLRCEVGAANPAIAILLVVAVVALVVVVAPA